jgi:hypothetical protein
MGPLNLIYKLYSTKEFCLMNIVLKIAALVFSYKHFGGGSCEIIERWRGR